MNNKLVAIVLTAAMTFLMFTNVWADENTDTLAPQSFFREDNTYYQDENGEWNIGGTEEEHNIMKEDMDNMMKNKKLFEIGGSVSSGSDGGGDSQGISFVELSTGYGGYVLKAELVEE